MSVRVGILYTPTVYVMVRVTCLVSRAVGKANLMPQNRSHNKDGPYHSLYCRFNARITMYAVLPDIFVNSFIFYEFIHFFFLFFSSSSSPNRSRVYTLTVLSRNFLTIYFLRFFIITHKIQLVFNTL